MSQFTLVVFFCCGPVVMGQRLLFLHGKSHSLGCPREWALFRLQTKELFYAEYDIHAGDSVKRVLHRLLISTQCGQANILVSALECQGGAYSISLVSPRVLGRIAKAIAKFDMTAEGPGLLTEWLGKHGPKRMV